MSCFVSHTSIDCRNAYELSEWWKPVLDYVDLEGDPNLPGHEECIIRDAQSGHRLLFIEVPEGKTVKNRVHLDVRVGEENVDAQVAKLSERGATYLHKASQGPHWWVTMADPEGNEFCVT